MPLVALWDFVNNQTLTDCVGGITLVNTGASPTGFDANGLVIVSGDDIIGVDISSLGLTECVLFASGFTTNTAAQKVIASLTPDDLDNTDLVTLHALNTEAGRAQVFENNLTQYSSGGLTDWTTEKRMAMAVATNEMQHAFEGLAGTLDTSAIVPVMDYLNVGIRAVASQPWDGTISMVALYDEVDGGTGDRQQLLEDLTDGTVVLSCASAQTSSGGSSRHGRHQRSRSMRGRRR